MTEVVILAAILLGGLLFGGGIVTGVWLARAVEHGFPKLPAPRPVPVTPTNGVHPVPQVVEVPVYEPPPFSPPPARPAPYRYGGHTEEESAANFERLREQLARQEANPLGDAYGA